MRDSTNLPRYLLSLLFFSCKNEKAEKAENTDEINS